MMDIYESHINGSEDYDVCVPVPSILFKLLMGSEFAYLIKQFLTFKNQP